MKREPKQKRPVVLAFTGPIIFSKEEKEAAMKQYGAASTAYLWAEIYRRRLAMLDAPRNKEEQDSIFCLQCTLGGIDELLKAASPDLDRLRGVLAEASTHWTDIALGRNYTSKRAAIDARRAQAEEKNAETRAKVRAKEAELRENGTPEHAITKNIMIDLGKDRKTVTKYRTKPPK